MMETRIYDSELKILNVLWQNGPTQAREIALILKKETDWSKTTTYTVIRKCLDKGFVSRREPGFVCQAMLTRQQVQQMETTELIDKLYGGAPDLLIASLIDNANLTQKQIEKLKQLVEELE